MPIHISYPHHETLNLPPQSTLIAAATAALSPKHQQHEVNIRVVSVEEITELNHTYRQKNKATNVLAFPPPAWPDMGSADSPPHLGDIAICGEIVALEANAQAIPLEAHWVHLIIHGVLHLQGYDHLEEKDATKMEELEDKLMQQLGYPSPYANGS